MKIEHTIIMLQKLSTCILIALALFAHTKKANAFSASPTFHEKKDPTESINQFLVNEETNSIPNVTSINPKNIPTHKNQDINWEAWLYLNQEAYRLWQESITCTGSAEKARALYANAQISCFDSKNMRTLSQSILELRYSLFSFLLTSKIPSSALRYGLDSQYTNFTQPLLGQLALEQLAVLARFSRSLIIQTRGTQTSILQSNSYPWIDKPHSQEFLSALDENNSNTITITTFYENQMQLRPDQNMINLIFNTYAIQALFSESTAKGLWPEAGSRLLLIASRQLIDFYDFKITLEKNSGFISNHPEQTLYLEESNADLVFGYRSIAEKNHLPNNIKDLCLNKKNRYVQIVCK